jgi:hypothetical protein
MASCRRKTWVESLRASPFGLWSVVSPRLPYVALLSLDRINAGLPRVALLFRLLQHTNDTIKLSPNLGALSWLAGLGPRAAVVLNGWAKEALGDELSRCLSSSVVVGVKYLTAERRWEIWTWFYSRCIIVQLE